MRMKTGFRKRAAFAVSAMLVVAAFSGCVKEAETTEQGADTQAAEEKERFSEGVDTPIEVTEYEEMKGTHAEYFLKQGDKVAVISPSSLPSRAQTDAVIKGLSEWGYVPVEGKYVCTADRTLDNCREDLEWALRDPEIKGIFTVRGDTHPVRLWRRWTVSLSGKHGNRSSDTATSRHVIPPGRGRDFPPYMHP